MYTVTVSATPYLLKEKIYPLSRVPLKDRDKVKEKIVKYDILSDHLTYVSKVVKSSGDRFKGRKVETEVSFRLPKSGSLEGMTTEYLRMIQESAPDGYLEGFPYVYGEGEKGYEIVYDDIKIVVKSKNSVVLKISADPYWKIYKPLKTVK